MKVYRVLEYDDSDPRLPDGWLQNTLDLSIGGARENEHRKIKPPECIREVYRGEKNPLRPWYMLGVSAGGVTNA